jgi:tetratricopeptide (TPR) repeat protein
MRTIKYKNQRVVLFIYTSIILFLNACTSSLTNIRSNPEGATVYLINKNNQKTRIGNTPLNIPAQQLNPNNESSVQIKVEKDGFKEESFFIPSLMVSSYIDLSVEMQPTAAPPSCEVQAKNTSVVARNIAQAMFLTQQKKFDQAAMLLNSLISENPDISVLYDLLGNIHYLNQQIDLALEAYDRSLNINPNSSETIRMVNKLKSIRTPAGGNQ